MFTVNIYGSHNWFILRVILGNIPFISVSHSDGSSIRYDHPGSSIALSRMSQLGLLGTLSLPDISVYRSQNEYFL